MIPKAYIVQRAVCRFTSTEDGLADQHLPVFNVFRSTVSFAEIHDQTSWPASRRRTMMSGARDS